jgi:hypothetical protein
MKVHVNVTAQYVGDYLMKQGENEVPKNLEKEVEKLYESESLKAKRSFDIIEEPVEVQSKPEEPTEEVVSDIIEEPVEVVEKKISKRGRKPKK